jgi:hypothetical protein
MENSLRKWLYNCPKTYNVKMKILHTGCKLHPDLCRVRSATSGLSHNVIFSDGNKSNSSVSWSQKVTDRTTDQEELKNRAGQSEVSDTARVVNEAYNRTHIISCTLMTIKLRWTTLQLSPGFTVEMRTRINTTSHSNT